MPRQLRPCTRCGENPAEWKSQYCEACKAIRRAERKATNCERERVKRLDPAYRQRQAAATAKRRRDDPEAARAALRRSNRRNYYRRTYGITNDEVEAMAAAQGHRCAICEKRAATLHVDHDPDTGVVRGLLCGTCNRGIGSLNHSVANLERAVAYLKEPPAARSTVAA